MYIATYDVENGRIAEAWAEWDNLADLMQLGYTPGFADKFAPPASTANTRRRRVRPVLPNTLTAAAKPSAPHSLTAHRHPRIALDHNPNSLCEPRRTSRKVSASGFS